MERVGIVTGRIYGPDDSEKPLSKQQLTDMRNLGIRAIRMEFEDHGDVESPTAARYREIIRWAGQRDIAVLGLLTRNSMEKPEPIPLSYSLDDFKSSYVPRFIQTVLEHDEAYGNVDGHGVEAWEILNEPNLDGDYRGGDGAEPDVFLAEYVGTLLVDVYEAAKPRIGDRKIVIGGMSRIFDRRVRTTFDSQAIRDFKQRAGRNVLPGDVIGIHGYGAHKTPYNDGYMEDPTPGNFETLVYYFLNRLPGFPFESEYDSGTPLIPDDQPIWMTEVGYGADRIGAGQVDYWHQNHVAAQLRYVLELLRDLPWFERVYWYVYRDDERAAKPTCPCNEFISDPRCCQWYGIRSVPDPACGDGAIKASYNFLANFHAFAGVGQEYPYQTFLIGDESIGQGREANSPVPPCDAFRSENAIWRAFIRNDTAENLVGSPTSGPSGGPYVHEWVDGRVQHFSGGTLGGELEGGDGAIGWPDGVDEAGYVYGNFYAKWIGEGGAPVVGYPVDTGGGADRYPQNSPLGGGHVQDFMSPGTGRGQLQRESGSGSVFYVREPILTAYETAGGTGRIGYATTDLAWVEADAVYRQDFRLCYITLDEAGNTAVHCEHNFPPFQLAMVIDTTGSMWDDIDSVKAAATEIVQALTLHNAEVSLVDYRDFPEAPYGGPEDYPYNPVLGFSSNPNEIVAAIEALTLGYGDDWPESVYSALMGTISGSGIGTWEPASRKFILLIGDAPPHDPEPFTGYDLASVVAAANGASSGPVESTTAGVTARSASSIVSEGIAIYSIVIGGDTSAAYYFSELSTATGGRMFTAETAADLPQAILEALSDIVQPPVIEAMLDIRPDVLNLRSRGQYVTAQLTLPQDFRSADVDPGSVRLNDMLPVVDLEPSGEQTLQGKFSRPGLEELLSPGNATLVVTGAVGGRRFQGMETIRSFLPGRRREQERLSSTTGGS